MDRTITTANRVARNTPERINRRIARETDRRIQYFSDHAEEIDERLRELDEEWDIERTLQANAASISIAAVLMGILFSRKWFLVPGIVGGFLLQHAIEGWCPPLPVLRRMGVRTQSEIERERCALEAIKRQPHVLHAGPPDAVKEISRSGR